MNTFLKNPALVPQIVLDLTRAQFIGDALLRPGPIASGGSVMWKEATPLFSLESDEIVAEYAEIPGVEFDAPILHTKATVKRGLSVKASQEMIDRDDVNTLMDNMRRARNTLVRTYDKQFMATIFNNPNVPVLASSGSWTGTGSTIRHDLAAAALLIQSAYAGTDTDQRFGYDPDTIVINNTTGSQWLDSDEIAKVFQGSPLASESLRYTGKLPKKFFSFDVLKSWQVPANTALLLERGTVGFISDERPLRGTSLYEDRPRETWRSDFTRMTVMAADNPKAACIITGI